MPGFVGKWCVVIQIKVVVFQRLIVEDQLEKRDYLCYENGPFGWFFEWVMRV